MKPLVLVKLGGSLLTDKRGEEAAREATIARLAAEAAGSLAGLAAAGVGLVLGHGSGSFGHLAAARAGLGAGPLAAGAAAGVATTQDAAARLHRRVVAALLAAGAAPFSLAPSAGWTARRGRLVAGSVEPLAGALELGLLPVVYGDVVADRAWGAAIASTEEVVRFLVPRLRRRGFAVGRVLWLGETPGLLDGRGETVPELDAASLGAALAGVGGAAGTDVTGGMLLRLRTARDLARRGLESWLVDGSRAGALAACLERAAVDLGSGPPGSPASAPASVTRFRPRRPSSAPP